MFWIDLVVSLVVGLVVAFQSRINGELGDRLGSGIQAAWWSIGTGLVLLIVLALIVPDFRAGLARLARAARPAAPGEPASLRWWFLLGGVGGVVIVSSQGMVVPALGVAIFTVAVVAGQTGSSLAGDAVGLAPGGPRAITASRVAATLLATLGVCVAVFDRFDESDFRVLLVLLAVIAGVMATIQQAFSSRVAVASESAWAATMANFVVGVAVLTVIVGIGVIAGGELAVPPAPWDVPWLWLGGPIGVTFVVVASFVVGRLGVLLFSLLTIAGQLVGALALDAFWPTPGAQVSWWLVAGTAITGVAVIFAARVPRSA